MPEHEVRSALRSGGFPAEVLNRMVCTAWYESRWHTGSYNHNRNGSVDFGLLQINSVHWRGCGVTRTTLADPVVNATCGYKVFRSQGLRAWYAYRSHKRICDNYAGGAVGQRLDGGLSEEEIQNGAGVELDGVPADFDQTDAGPGADVPPSTFEFRD
jgi:hypothetical protein